jgi:hypothetical protein
LEILLGDGLSDTARSTLLARLDAALERWKLPRFSAIFFTVLVAPIISFPSWAKGLVDFLELFGIHTRVDVIGNFISNISPRNVVLFGVGGIGYLVAIPVTGFLAKRGLFVGRESARICFPGGQEGSGAYFKEREILGNVGIHARERPMDLWLLALGVAISILGTPLFLDFAFEDTVTHFRFANLSAEVMENIEDTLHELRVFYSVALPAVFTVLLGSFLIAGLRRRTGRA